MLAVLTMSAKKLKYISSKIIAVLQNNVVLAIAINTLCFLGTIILCDQKWQISDDYVIDSILSGGYGKVTPYLPYVNVLLGNILTLFVKIFPSYSVFFCFQLLLSFISSILLTIVLLENNGTLTGLVITGVFLSFFSDDLYILPTYT